MKRGKSPMVVAYYSQIDGLRGLMGTVRLLMKTRISEARAFMILSVFKKLKAI